MISEQIGELIGMMLLETSLQPRKENQIKTIQGTLTLEEISPFKRIDYLNFFKNLSTASANRDLKEEVELGIFLKEIEKNQVYYYLLQI